MPQWSPGFLSWTKIIFNTWSTHGKMKKLLQEGSGENPKNAPLLDDQDSDHDTEDCAGEDVITKARMQEGRLLFVHSLAIKVAFSIWSGSCFLGCHLQNNQVLVTVILCCCQDQCWLHHCSFVYCPRRDNKEYYRSSFHYKSSVEATPLHDWSLRRRNKFHRVNFSR